MSLFPIKDDLLYSNGEANGVRPPTSGYTYLFPGVSELQTGQEVQGRCFLPCLYVRKDQFMLSDAKILHEMHEGNIVISPFDSRQLGTNSYDCRLGAWYFQGDANIVEKHIDNAQEARAYWGKPIKAKRKIPIRPGSTILAHTQEIIGGCNGYLAEMRTRSTVARNGLSVCRCAGVGDVGYISYWTMEISNHTGTTIWVPVGYRICQMIFQYVGETLKNYAGNYGQLPEFDPYDMLPKDKKDWDYDIYNAEEE
jgi:dCTP deaminase